MEKLDYKDLLNKNAINYWYTESLISVLIGYGFYTWADWCIILGIIWQMYFLAKIPRGYKEKKEIKNTISHYNDYVELHTFSLVEDELREEYCVKAKLWILDNYARIWKPKFIYEDEEQVYKSDEGDVYIASGYFKYTRAYKRKEYKAKYRIIFKDGEHYMSNIGNLVLSNYKNGLPELYEQGAVYGGVTWMSVLIFLLIDIALFYSYISY